MKILIIDDEALIVDLYRTALERAGYKVSSAYDGKEGLSKIAKIKPDLILLDIMMPKVTGMEILDELKEDDELRKIPVVMLTNLTWVDDKNSPLKKGAIEIWIKAVNKPSELVERVEKLFIKLKKRKKKGD